MKKSADDDTALERFRALIDEGIKDHNEGRYIEIRNTQAHRAFFDDIKRRGRARLKLRRQQIPKKAASRS